MRRRPVTRSEIRFDDVYGRIRTLPIDAVRVDENDDLPWLGHIVPIAKLWAPLLRELTEWRKRDVAKRQAALGFRQNPPEPITLPERLFAKFLKLRTCQRCDREFYCVSSNGRYCSDDCAKQAWRPGRAGSVAAASKARSEARAAARANRRCGNPACNEPLAAQRSTLKFCSVRCRVAAHREGKRDATA